MITNDKHCFIFEVISCDVSLEISNDGNDDNGLWYENNMDMGGPSTNESPTFYKKSGETYNVNNKTRQQDKNDGSDMVTR